MYLFNCVCNSLIILVVILSRIFFFFLDGSVLFPPVVHGCRLISWPPIVSLYCSLFLVPDFFCFSLIAIDVPVYIPDPALVKFTRLVSYYYVYLCVLCTRMSPIPSTAIFNDKFYIVSSNQRCGSGNVTGPDPVVQLITDPAGCGSYLDVFAAIEKI
jgi:hypothetical protein